MDPEACPCPDVHCLVCRGRLSKRFSAKNRFIDQVKKPLKIRLIQFLNEFFICLSIWTVELESLLVGWCDSSKIKVPITGPAEPVRSVRPWPDQLFGKIIKKFCFY